FPETVLQRTRPHRIAIPHANVPNMVAQILTAVAAQPINIADMLNHSRGELSYTLVDLDAAPNTETLARIRKIDGILAARVLPVVESGGRASDRPAAKPMSKRKPPAAKPKTPRAKKSKRPEREAGGESSLLELRNTIDEIDANIQQLIAARARC